MNMEVNDWCEFLKNQERTELYQKIEGISNLLSWGCFSVKYMKHDPSWMYDKLIGFKRGENPVPVAPMTAEEIKMLKVGLEELSQEIKRVAESL